MGANGEQHDAKALIEHVKANYSSCQSYADCGQLTSILAQSAGEPIVTYQTFSTASVRPDRFRFEFRDRFPEGQFGRHVIWREGKIAKTWGYQFCPKVRIECDLSLALAGATGISHGVAVTIPQLLLSEEFHARGLFSENAAEWIGNEECHNKECVKIRSAGGSSYLKWIDVESHLILRVEEQTAVCYQTSGWIHAMILGQGSLMSRKIINYRPEMNVVIPLSRLEFGEPFAGYGDDVELLD